MKLFKRNANGFDVALHTNEKCLKGGGVPPQDLNLFAPSCRENETAHILKFFRQTNVLQRSYDFDKLHASRGHLACLVFEIFFKQSFLLDVLAVR